MELISIVVPVYNVDKYLKYCIESLINQEYKNIEIILVDDESTDNSGKICDEFASVDKRIKVIHKKNEGLGYTRNRGMQEANGKYVVFIDSDDYASKTLVSDLYNNMQSKNVEVCFGGQNLVTSDGKLIKSYKYENQVFKDDDVNGKLLPMLIGSSPKGHDNLSLSACNVLYPLYLLNEKNIKFKSERQYISEDLIFNIEVLNAVKSAALINECNYYYRTNPNSLTHKYREDRYDMCKALCKYEETLLKEIKVIDNCKFRLSRQFFINLRSCIQQEKIQISKKTRREAINAIKQICNDEFVINTIKEYPVEQLAIKQKVFVKMLQYKMARILYICASIGVF